MHTVKSVFLGILLGITPLLTLAQNSTNSPYTRYGYGNLADQSFISQRGMGGIGYGLRNPQLINPMNPASYSTVDSLTFMFDFGISGQSSWLKDNTSSEQRFNGNLENIALQFPLAKKLGIGAGFEPISSVGYSYANSSYLDVDSSRVQNIYSGSGGLSRVYVALSYDLLNRLSVGAKLSYLFGDIVHDNLVTFSSANIYNIDWVDTIRSYGFTYDLGVQYHQAIGKFKYITVGVVYSPKIRFGAKVISDTIRSDPSSGTIMSLTSSVSTDLAFELPESYGVGFTYNRLGKLTVGADVLYQKWASAKYYDQTNVFNNRLKLNAGGEFIPNRTSSNILSKIRYRGGLFYGNSYLKVKDSKYNEYGVNLGLGIPVSDKRSFLNLAFEYSRVHPELNTLVDEQYFKVSLSYTFNELWFFKRKVQ
jgi:hypothetical protein